MAPVMAMWGMTVENELTQALEIELKLFPEDERMDFRAAWCSKYDTLGGVIFCLYASVAHPNVLGARAYADAIIEELRVGGLLEEWTMADGQ